MSETPDRSTRRIPFWLTVSLLFNLLLLGLVTGMALRQIPDRPDRGDRPRYTSEMTPDARKAMFGLMRESYRETRAEREVRDAARRALSEALKAEPFDSDRVRAAFADLREADNAVHAATHDAMIVRLQALPPEQRQGVADMLGRGSDRSRRNERRLPPPPRD